MTQSNAEALVHLQGVNKVFQSPAGRAHVLKDVNFAARRGEFVGVRGPSGSGKTTLVNLITGIDRPTSGTVTVAGQEVGALDEDRLARFRGRHMGLIFQFFQLLPTLTVLENVMLPMALARTAPRHERRQRALAALQQAGLAASQAGKLPSALSGGQQQRVAIARALVNDPPLLVADEPTGNLDSRSALAIFDLFEGLAAQGKTFIIVTHDNELTRRLPRVVEVRDGVLCEPAGREGAHGHRAA